MKERMKNLYMLLSRKTDPKARRPNKMTSSEKHKNKKVIIAGTIQFNTGMVITLTIDEDYLIVVQVLGDVRDG